MGKLCCFIYDDMADFELTFATHLGSFLKDKEIVTISYDGKTVTSKPGIRYQPHMSVKEALALDDIDGLIIPGGWNDEQRPELTTLIQQLNQEGKLLAAICAGPQYLARAGVLEDKFYTTTLSEDYMISQGKTDFFPRHHFVKKNVVLDKNVITAVGNAFVDFAIEVFHYFEKFSTEDERTNFTKHYKGL